MELTRREFGKNSILGLVLLSCTEFFTGVLSGCTWPKNLYQNILSYTTLGLDAFQSIISLLTASGIIIPVEGAAISTVVALVKAGFADLQVAVTNYEAAPAANKTTLLGKISTALAVLQAQLGTFWANLSLPTGTKVSLLVQGLLGIIVSTLAGFATQLPPPAASATARSVNVLARLGVTAQKRTPAEFKKDFNSLLIQGGYPQYIVR